VLKKRLTEEYLKNIVLAFGRDAQGILIQLLPIVLRVNISVVDIDSSMKECGELKIHDLRRKVHV